MPYIGARITGELTPEKEKSIKAGLGRAIECIPGKTEAWLMVEFTDNCRLWFKGDNSKPSAYIEVKVLGKLDHKSTSAMTGEICRIFNSELSIPEDRIYVKYEECSLWGWNGSNF